MKKKIMIYITSMKPAGGIERVVASIANALSDEFYFSIFTKDSTPSHYFLKDSIKHYKSNDEYELIMNLNKIQRILRILKKIFSNLNRNKKMIKKINPDYIYTTNIIDVIEVILCGYRKKIIATEHGSKFAYNNFYKILKKIVYPFINVVVVPTTMDTELYLKEKIKAIYIPHFNPYEKIKKSSNNKKNNQIKIALNIGRLTKDKQQEKLLEIWKSFLQGKEDKKKWKLKIVGDGEEKNNLLNFINKEGLKDSVELISSVKNIEKYYKEADVFLLTSKFEGFGMVLLEALSFEVPCISFNSPSGPKDIVIDQVNGFLVEKNNSDDFLMKLKEISSNPQLLKKMSENALSKSKYWSNDEIKRKWIEILGG